MNALLWIAQVLLAPAFLAHGLIFIFPPKAVRKIKERPPLPAGFMHFVYVAESLGAVGIVLPGATGLLPWLTPLAAAGLLPIAAGASVFHATRGETAPMVVTAALFALAAFVAYGRLFVVPL